VLAQVVNSAVWLHAQFISVNDNNDAAILKLRRFSRPIITHNARSTC